MQELTVAAHEVQSKDRLLTAQGYIYVDKVVPHEGNVVIHTSRYPITVSPNVTLNVRRPGAGQQVARRLFHDEEHGNLVSVRVEDLTPGDFIATPRDGLKVVLAVNAPLGRQGIAVTLSDGEKHTYPTGAMVALYAREEPRDIDLITPEILSIAMKSAEDLDHEDHDEAVTVALVAVAPLIAAQAIKRVEAQLAVVKEGLQ
jgi:hypothetical protein